MKRISIIILLSLTLIGCEREIENQIQEAQKEEQGASVECLEAHTKMINQLLEVWTSVEYTAEECCLDPVKSQQMKTWLQNRDRK